PWASVDHALSLLRFLARENFPVRILLDDTPTVNDSEYGLIAVYDTVFDLAPFVTLEPLNQASGGLVHLRPVLSGERPLITGAEGAVLRNLVLRPTFLTDLLSALLSIVDVS